MDRFDRLRATLGGKDRHDSSSMQDRHCLFFWGHDVALSFFSFELVCRSVGRLVGWSVDRLIGWSVDRSVGRFDEWLVIVVGCLVLWLVVLSVTSLQEGCHISSLFKKKSSLNKIADARSALRCVREFRQTSTKKHYRLSVAYFYLVFFGGGVVQDFEAVGCLLFFFSFFVGGFACVSHGVYLETDEEQWFCAEYTGRSREQHNTDIFRTVGNFFFRREQAGSGREKGRREGEREGWFPFLCGSGKINDMCCSGCVLCTSRYIFLQSVALSVSIES